MCHATTPRVICPSLWRVVCLPKGYQRHLETTSAIGIPAMSENRGQQSLFLIRHGDRYDYAHPKWRESSTRPDDPPLSVLGFKQARETGEFLDSLFTSEEISVDRIIWMSSPFLRCLQTSHAAIDAFQKVGEGVSEIKIFPEYSIFEWDGQGGKFHESLPGLEERKHYFPRLDIGYESVFIPKLPEPRSEFHNRCQKAASEINRRYPFRAKSAIIAVTHAAGCIGLAAAFTNRSISDITPAAPCSIYRLTRTSDTSAWKMDPHDLENGMNGQTSHLSDLGQSTVPWNHFGDKKHFKGYTGPATSRFAPTGLIDRQEL